MKTTSINLAALKNAAIIKSGKNKDVDCIIIPIDQNHLYKSDKGGLYLNLIHFEMKEPKDFATHIVKQSLPKEVREQMPEDEQQPILGNSKFIESSYQEAAPVVADDEDSLPF